MDFKVGVGKSDFDELRNSGNYYVDKTEMIYDLVHNTDNEVTLFTRPRRFGKTLMMSMIENFLSYNDYHESYYHAFLAGVFVGLGYEVESNKEKGLGRPDILLKDGDNRRAIINRSEKIKA